jgi:hypothetical protein
MECTGLSPHPAQRSNRRRFDGAHSGTETRAVNEGMLGLKSGPSFGDLSEA